MKTDKDKTVPTRYTHAGKGEPAPFELEKEIDGCKKRHAVLVANHESNVIELARLREQVADCTTNNIVQKAEIRRLTKLVAKYQDIAKVNKGIHEAMEYRAKDAEAELTRLREQVAELTKCGCVVNTNWHEGVPYYYKVTCNHCDTQLDTANAFCEVAAKMDSFDYHPLMIAWKKLQNWRE